MGRINKIESRSAITYMVTSVTDVELLIKFLDNYPLITDKLRDYALFKQAFNLMQQDLHLTMKGLLEIVSLKVSMNNFSKKKQLANEFKNIKPAIRPIVTNKKLKDLQWLAGFARGESCFGVIIQTSPTHKIGFLVRLNFTITQHSRSEALLKSFIDYLDCGRLERV